MAEVLPHLYISSYPYAANALFLEIYGITHVVNLTYEYLNVFPTRFQYLRIPAKDVPSERLGPYFRDIAAFVATAKEGGGKALVHCHEGISRSATGVLACMMINDHIRLSDAFALLKKAKPDVEPNQTFLRELRVLENDIFGEYCMEKLTVLDEVREILLVDWKESLAVVLAQAATSAIPFSSSVKWSQAIWNEFHAAAVNGVRGIQPLFESAIVSSLESFGGRNERDVRARSALEDILTMGLMENSICTQSDLVQILTSISEGDALQDLYIDVPEASYWMDELLRKLVHT
jgi:hypothetical protein